MKILGETEIQKLIEENHFLDDNEDNEEKDLDFVSKCFLYVKFLDFLEKEKSAANGSFSLSEIWHSHYFWTKLYMKMHGSDVGWEDYLSHVLERMDQELEGEIDWDFLEKAEDVMENNDSLEIILKALDI